MFAHVCLTAVTEDLAWAAGGGAVGGRGARLAAEHVHAGGARLVHPRREPLEPCRTA